MIILKAMMRNKWFPVMVVLIPIIIIGILFPLVQSTSNQITVPIAIVDESDQSITQEIVQELESDGPYSVDVLTNMPDEAFYQREYEAVFVFPHNMLGKIKRGQHEQIVTWYRHSETGVDALLKEKLAGELMKLATRAEAASIVLNRSESDLNSEEVFQYGLRYLEPELIFQMNFESFEGGKENQEVEDDHSYSLVHLSAWIYIWILVGYFGSHMLHWQREKIIQRFQISYSGRNSIRALWFYMVSSISIILYFFSLFLSDISGIFDLSIGRDIKYIFALPILSVCLYLFSLNVSKNKQSLFAFAVGYGAASTVMVLLIQLNILDFAWWMLFFIPVWLLI
ncbi:hypothetical protein CEY16_00345 [Halalkalibacillus sediminis]|uniref:ABC-2 type transporter transmembrane domain-containing protein n=1 Tax=Halalkalibacillus sediminis TaxID=2018042 RepID=A0A2I0QV65_9BACI|nr:ABC transporter permease [Halalkalibacillus sediminis]PKR78243.1 hypothetical protein CEY16_00345 [Halalkalibacillus sediminis]